MRGSGNGAISLVSEYIANRVTHLLGWPVPDVAWIYIEDGFPWVFGTDEFDDILVKSYGWNLGIEYIEQAVPLKTGEHIGMDPVLPDIIYTIDLFFMNVDRTRMAGNFIRDAEGKTWVIDHGQLMLFQPVSLPGLKLFPTHCFYEQYKNRAFRYKKELHNIPLFRQVVNEIPEKLLPETSFTKTALLSLIERRIFQLETTGF